MKKLPLFSLLFIGLVLPACAQTGTTLDQTSMVPTNTDNMYMFDWIFFAIIIPIPLLVVGDMYLNRKVH